MRHVKGSHIVVPRVHAEEHAYILQNADKRIVFVIPYEERLLADRHHRRRRSSDFEQPAISDDEIDYLLEARQPLPREAADAAPTWSGPSAACGRSTTTARRDPSAITRDYVFKLDTRRRPRAAAPVLSIFGGKITTYRKLAEHALARAARRTSRR